MTRRHSFRVALVLAAAASFVATSAFAGKDTKGPHTKATFQIEGMT